jgi:threonine aldolase
VFLRPVPHAKWVRKQLMQLASKHRYLAAQVTALLEGDLAERAARHANAMAARLAAGVSESVEITRLPQANAVFARLDRTAIAALQREAHFHVWDEATGEVRWMTAWDTTEGEVDAFAALVRATV